MYIERMELIKALLPSLETSNNVRQLVSLEKQPSTENPEKGIKTQASRDWEVRNNQKRF